MTCRPATVADVPRLVQLSQLEHARSRFKHLRFDREYVARCFTQAVSGMLSQVFVSERGLGFIGGVVQPYLFNGYLSAYELCWYAEDGSGMALLEEFTRWARRMRAVELVISNYAGISEPEKFTRVMKRAGFQLLGTTYTKRLEA